MGPAGVVGGNQIHAQIPRQRGRRGQGRGADRDANTWCVASGPRYSRPPPTRTSLERNGWEAYSLWHLGLTDAQDETKARHAFVLGTCAVSIGVVSWRAARATQWDHKEIELVSHDLIQKLDARRGRVERKTYDGARRRRRTSQ